MEVLGDRLIHVEYYLDASLDFATNEEIYAGHYWSDELDIEYGSAWGHRVCEDDGPENCEDEKRTLSGGEVYGFRLHELCSPPSRSQDPAMLKYCGDRNEMMHLTLLRSCRQIYVEANSMLWTTNTYSFSDATTFKRFMMTRNIHQKRMIRKLRIDFPGHLAGCEASWDGALNTALIRSMSGLRCLRIQMDFIMETTHYKYAKNNNCLSALYFTVLKQLSTLPLMEVEVYVGPPWLHQSNSSWTKEDREEFADGLRGMLLDSRGAEIYAEEQREQKEWVESNENGRQR